MTAWDVDGNDDHDGRPIAPGDRLTEAERAAHWAKVNHAPARAHLADLSCDGLHE